MIDFANAKINLGLHITGKRTDGYHLLESLFVPISLYDIVEITPQTQGTIDNLSVIGDIDTGETANNLVLRAVRALRLEYEFPSVNITLKKQIPSGAGLGGGSADATTTLKVLRQLFSLSIDDNELRRIALTLGADCPFFVTNRPKIVRGVGEEFYTAPEIDFSPYHLLIIKPEIHISTAEAFRGLKDIGKHKIDIEDIVTRPIIEWRDYLVNDFETSLFIQYPELATIKKHLYEMGAVYASLTGSGSALYGLFRKDTPLEIEVFYTIHHAIKIYTCHIL